MLTNALSQKSVSFDGHAAYTAKPGLLGRRQGRPGPEAKVVALRRAAPEIGTGEGDALIAISPAHSVRRRLAAWSGAAAEIVQTTNGERTDFRYRGPRHLLVLFDKLIRRDGTTVVDGLPVASLRDVSRKLIFVPAGCEFRHWHAAKSAGRMICFYFDVNALPHGQVMPERPRLFFEDSALLATADKLVSLIEGSHVDSLGYLEALGHVLVHELMRSGRSEGRAKQVLRGGLASWQQRIVTAYIEEHLAEPIPLATLAELAGLSAYHFCRAFKQSFGQPPHRYHTNRRIEHAKTLLAKGSMSVTEVGMSIGFAETSSFTAAFRKATGMTPSAYQRSLV